LALCNKTRDYPLRSLAREDLLEPGGKIVGVGGVDQPILALHPKLHGVEFDAVVHLEEGRLIPQRGTIHKEDVPEASGAGAAGRFSVRDEPLLPSRDSVATPAAGPGRHTLTCALPPSITEQLAGRPVLRGLSASSRPPMTSPARSTLLALLADCKANPDDA